MSKVMLIDGNSLTYRAFFALPTDMATASGQVTNAVFGFTSMLINLLKDHRPDLLGVAFDRREPTFRHKALASYKANRDATPDILIQQMGLVPPEEAAPRIREAVSRALAADSTIAEAHFARATLQAWTDWEWDAAEASFLRAIELNPSYAEARIYYAHLLMHLDRQDEALEQARLAVEMDPVSPLIRSLQCVVSGLARRYEVALTQCEEVLQRDPRQIVARDGLTNAFLGLERWDDHIDNEIARARELGFDWLADILERSYPANGLQAAHGEAADSMLARASRGEFMPPGQLALYLGYAGRTEEALDWFERAFEQHDPLLPYLIDSPWPAEMTSNPRFYDVFDRMGLPPRD